MPIQYTLHYGHNTQCETQTIMTRLSRRLQEVRCYLFIIKVPQELLLLDFLWLKEYFTIIKVLIILVSVILF